MVQKSGIETLILFLSHKYPLEKVAR